MSFFAYAINYSLSLVVISKLGKIDGAYDSKAKWLLPNFEMTCQGALFEGHNKKRYPCPMNKQSEIHSVLSYLSFVFNILAASLAK